MFGRRSQVEELPPEEREAPKPPPIIVEQPKPHLVIVKGNSLEQYEEVAESLGFCPGQLLEEQIFRFLAQEKIMTFKFDEINKYLISKAKKNYKWVWRPLRKQDRTTDFNVFVAMNDMHGRYDATYEPYDKAVPLKILKDVKKVNDKFGNKVAFFVSDFDHMIVPDPFIMVTAKNVDTIIFGVWDEPDFGV